MKKILTITLGILMLFGVPVVAKNEITNEKVNGYEKFQGEVMEITSNEKVNELLVKTENSKMYIFVNKERIMDLKTGKFVKDHKFSKGEKVVFYIKRNSPLFLSEPPKAGPDIVAINEGSGNFSIDVDYFDKEGNGVSDRLKINSFENTEILTIKGNKYEKDNVFGKNLLVLYTISTKSIPPQTTPEKVIVLSDIKNENVYLPTDKSIIDEKEVYPLRSYYEQLGAKVEWEPETMSITISIEGEKIEIDTKNSTLKIDDKKSDIEYFTIKDGVSYSTIKLYEDINKYFFE